MSSLKEFLQENEKSIGANGGAWDSCEALTQINSARAILYGLDNWIGTLKHICVHSCHVVNIPWFAESIKAAYTCNKSILISDGEYWAPANKGCCEKQVGFTDNASYSPIPAPLDLGCRIGVMPRDLEDYGKKVSVSYYTTKGSLVSEELVLGSSFSVTENRVGKVEAITKDSTFGIVSFFSATPRGKKACFLFNAHPMETSLRYRQYCFNDPCCNQCKQLVLIVKKKFFRFTKEHYNHQIEFPDHALALAMEAISEKDKRTAEGISLYERLIQTSIRYLKKNTQEENETFSEMTASNDYPSIIGSEYCYR